MLKLTILTLIAIFAAVIISACTESNAGTPVSRIYWSDGDSGTIDGRGFRLANWDAPETCTSGCGRVAQCQEEVKLGLEAKWFMTELTEGADVKITRIYNTDGRGRLVVDLSVGVVDVATRGAQEGFLKPWPFKDGVQQADKPLWCGQ